jgi:hypothetical protein
MLKKVIIVLAVALAAFSAYVAKQPSQLDVSRSVAINAPAPEVFSHVNDFHKWAAWSPWANLDPNMQVVYGGPSEAGLNSHQTWSGNSDVGAGKMTITEVIPNSLVKIALEMEKPLKASDTVEFVFKEEAGSTMVTWHIQGQKDFIGKLMGVIYGCEKKLGASLEEGLANLKKVSEEVKTPVEAPAADAVSVEAPVDGAAAPAAPAAASAPVAAPAVK